ncbi:MAG: hypothetical protein KBS65_02710 [Prevotella sp.]|nr:hypothetical protein [Candidatus Equicola stercoris]
MQGRLDVGLCMGRNEMKDMTRNKNMMNYKKTYMTPCLEVVLISGEYLLNGSPTPSGNKPQDEVDYGDAGFVEE